MKCHICDKEDSLITYNKFTKEFSPCNECQSIIQETIEGYEQPDLFDENDDLVWMGE